MVLLERMKIDDPVGAISAHGVVGFWGLLAVPLSNTDASFSVQLIGAGTIFAWVFGTSFIVWLLVKGVMGIRASKEEELAGLDMAECGLHAYPEFVTGDSMPISSDGGSGKESEPAAELLPARS